MEPSSNREQIPIGTRLYRLLQLFSNYGHMLRGAASLQVQERQIGTCTVADLGNCRWRWSQCMYRKSALLTQLVGPLVFYITRCMCSVLLPMFHHSGPVRLRG